MMDFEEQGSEENKVETEYDQVPEETEMKKDRFPRGIMIGLCILLGFACCLLFVMKQKIDVLESRNQVLSSNTLGKLGLIHADVQKEFLFDTKDADFEAGVLKGYLSALEDPYTEYYTPEEYKEICEINDGRYSGIGAVMQEDPETGAIRILQVYEGSPAEKGGLEPGDEIIQVEQQSVADMDLSVVVSKIKGKAGTKVKIKVYRPSAKKNLNIQMKRAEIEVPSVGAAMIQGKVGYIQLESFDELTYDQFMKAFKKLKAKGMESLIVDLRYNGGGLLDSVVKILDRLLPEGTITYTEDKNGNRETYTSDKESILDVPCYVLTNEYSASASEIFVGAMQDYKMAKIVGETTFGKGIVQVLRELSDGSAFKITIARYYTPNGVCIQGTGIEPDYKVKADPKGKKDPQLDYILKKLLHMKGATEKNTEIVQ